MTKPTKQRPKLIPAEVKQPAIEASLVVIDRFLAARGPGHFGDAPTMRGTGLERGARG